MHISIVLLVSVASVINNCYSWSIPPTNEKYNPYEPHARQIRQVFGSFKPSKGGVRGTVGASTTLLNENGHRLDGHSQISRDWKPNGPTEFGGGLNYQGPRAAGSIDANHARHLGTDLKAQGNVNLWRSNNGRSQLNGTANYDQHFGGSGGRSPPNFGGGINFVHRF